MRTKVIDNLLGGGLFIVLIGFIFFTVATNAGYKIGGTSKPTDTLVIEYGGPHLDTMKYLLRRQDSLIYTLHRQYLQIVGRLNHLEAEHLNIIDSY